MEKHFTLANYSGTDKNDLYDEEYNITPEIKKHLQTLYLRAQDKEDQTVIDELKNLIGIYPNTPILKNYLVVAYTIQGKQAEAEIVNDQLLDQYPRYLYGLFNEAIFYFKDSEGKRLPGVFIEGFNLEMLYPDREEYHVDELISYFAYIAHYLLYERDVLTAISILETLKDVAPNAQKVQVLEQHADYKHFYELKIQRLERRETIHEPILVKEYPYTDKTEVPSFHHPEIHDLYTHGIRIPQEKLKTILSLPRKTLIEDLEKVINDGVERYFHFSSTTEEETQTFFVLHAFFLLKELKSESSLPTMLAFLEYGEDFQNYWFGDHLTISLWFCFYELGVNSIPKLTEFLLKPGLFTFSKACIADTLARIATFNSSKSEEVEKAYFTIMNTFNKASIDDNLIDSVVLGIMMDNALECEFNTLNTIIQALLEKNRITLRDEEDIEAEENNGAKEKRLELKKKYEQNPQALSPNIFDLYPVIADTWQDYQDEAESPYWRILPRPRRTTLPEEPLFFIDGTYSKIVNH